MSGLDSKVSSLLHFDIDFTDAVGENIWEATGDAIVYNIQNKFGGKSLYLNKSSYLKTSFSEKFNVSTGDFTIDWWEYPVSGAAYPVVFSIDSPTNEAGLVVGESVSGTRNCYISSTATSGWDICAGFSLGGVTNNEWSHFALVRKGDTFYGFKNGILTSTVKSSSAIYLKETFSPIIGKRTNNGYDYWFLGYIDEFRFSKGIARWTKNFTPPNNPYSKVRYLAKTSDNHYHAYLNSAWTDLGIPADDGSLQQLFLNNEVIDAFDKMVITALNVAGAVKQCAYQEEANGLTPNETIQGVPATSQFIHEIEDISFKDVSNIDWIHINDNIINYETGNGKIRMVVSRDSGLTWQAYNTTTLKWDTVLDTSNAADGHYDAVNTKRFIPSADAITRLLSVGMNVITFNAAPFNDFTLAAGYKTLRVGYILNIESTSDVAISDSLKYQYDGIGDWVLGANWTHYKVQTRNSSHTLTWLSPINGTRVKVNY